MTVLVRYLFGVVP